MTPLPECTEYNNVYNCTVMETVILEQMEEFMGKIDGLYVFFSNDFLPRDLQGKQYSKCFIAKDITECGEVEESLKIAHDKLREKIIEYTAELEKTSKSLIKNERRFSEAQKIAHIGIWEWNLVTNEKYWSDEMYRIYGLNPQESVPNYNVFLNYVHPDDRANVDNATKEALKGKSYAIDFRIITTNGEENIVHSRGEALFDENKTPIQIIGAVMDITERKKAENALAKIEAARKREIHHRIKNNLQVVSSLLDLQAERFKNRKNVKNSEIIEAFRESQDRVMSIALIHEELHEGEREDTLNFSLYLKRLVDKLFLTYRLGNPDISLNIDVKENFFFDMDTAIPLGIITNELISNSLKHAFKGRNKGKIEITLCRDENIKSTNIMEKSKNEGCKNTNLIFIVSDNGFGIPEYIDIENPNSLGLQLLISLVDQLNGELELKRNKGSEFTLKFTITENDKLESTKSSLQLIDND